MFLRLIITTMGWAVAVTNRGFYRDVNARYVCAVTDVGRVEWEHCVWVVAPHISRGIIFLATISCNPLIEFRIMNPHVI